MAWLRPTVGVQHAPGAPPLCLAGDPAAGQGDPLSMPGRVTLLWLVCLQHVYIVPNKTIAFVRFEWRVSAEFAKEAMNGQTLDGSSMNEALKVGGRLPPSSWRLASWACTPAHLPASPSCC